MNTKKVTRVEVIDWATGEGRAYVWRKNVPVDVECMLQDDGRTLKVFIKPLNN